MSKLDKQTLTELTNLCRIKCTESELKTLHKNLESILKYIERMNEVNTDNVEVCNHVCRTSSNVLREDQIEKTLSREIFLKNSPSHVAGMVRVPTIINKG